MARIPGAIPPPSLPFLSMNEYPQEVFNMMPLAGLIANRILCMHGGLSPKLKSLDQVSPPSLLLSISLLFSFVPSLVRVILLIPLFTLIFSGLIPTRASLYSSTHSFSISSNEYQGWHNNTRGVSYIFGPNVVADACSELDIDLVARAHQVHSIQYPSLQYSVGGARWIRILRQSQTGDNLLGSSLLWSIR